MLARQTIPASSTPSPWESLTAALQRRYGSAARALSPDKWVFEVRTGARRSQLVHLFLRDTLKARTGTARLVALSPVGPLPLRCDLEGLLRHNASLAVGAICIEDFRDETNDQVTYLTLRASCPAASARPEDVFEMIEEIAYQADQLERDLYAHDVH